MNKIFSLVVALVAATLYASPAFAGDPTSPVAPVAPDSADAAAVLSACPNEAPVVGPRLSLGRFDIDLFATAKTWLNRYVDGLGYEVDGPVTEGTIGARWNGWRVETTRIHSWEQKRGVEQDLTLAKRWRVADFDVGLSANHYNFGRLRDLWKGDILSPELEISRKFEFGWGSVTPSLLAADLIGIPEGEHRLIGRAKLDFAIPLGDRGTLSFAPIVRRDGGNSQADEGWLFSVEGSLALTFNQWTVSGGLRYFEPGPGVEDRKEGLALWLGINLEF